MVQTTGEQVQAAVWALIRRLKQLAGADGADPAAMAIVHLVNEYGPLRLTALAQVAGLDASTASRHVRNLEAAGQLSRAADPQDGRAAQIAITESGRTLLREAVARRARHFDEALAAWPEEDRAALPRLLNRLVEDLA
jgi:DNA-binding MarR family transcriptional regulator